jgi:biopolymer transport protein ExbB
VLEIVMAGGWLMIPILLCSAAAMGIIVERFWSLRDSAVTPKPLLDQAWQWARARDLGPKHIEALRRNSPLGRVLAAGLENRHKPRIVIMEVIEDTGRHVVHELERFLNTLGTIAAVSPLLGLLGTVIGMINVFSTILEQGVGNANALAGGISQALITTAAGLTVAIPALMFYRYFRGRIGELVITMEEQAFKLVAALEDEDSRPRTATPKSASQARTP